MAELKDAGEGFARAAGGLVDEHFESAVEEPVGWWRFGTGEAAVGAAAENCFGEEAADDLLAPEVSGDDALLGGDIDFEAEAAGHFGDFRPHGAGAGAQGAGVADLDDDGVLKGGWLAQGGKDEPLGFRGGIEQEGAVTPVASPDVELSTAHGGFLHGRPGRHADPVGFTGSGGTGGFAAEAGAGELGAGLGWR